MQEVSAIFLRKREERNMQILAQSGLLILGFLLLIKGADWFVGGASKLADRFGIPQLVIGLTIVAMGTSAPEAAVSISAALKNTPENNSAAIAIGNILGSNILNILLILGIVAVIGTIPVQVSTVRWEIPFMILVTAVLSGIGYFKGYVGKADGVILWIFMIIYLLYLLRMARQGQLEGNTETRRLKVHEPISGMLVLLVLGIAAIVTGSNITVDAASALARIFGMSERLIGLTIVAFGTSLPELITSVTAALRKNADIAVGNIVGSNIFNILFVIGTAALITDVAYINAFYLDSIVCILTAVLLLVCVAAGKKLNRVHGVIFLGAFAAYYGYILL